MLGANFCLAEDAGGALCRLMYIDPPYPVNLPSDRRSEWMPCSGWWSLRSSST